MATRIPETLYTGGNVQFDSTPTVNNYRQIEAERKAKQDAVDDYMRGLRGRVTPAGMRVNDIEAFDHMRRKWQDFGIQNRERMARDPRLKAEFDAMANDLISFAEKSKAEEEALKPFVGMLTDPNKREKVRPEVFGMVDTHNRPLMKKNEQGEYEWDYERKPIDYTSKIFKDPDFDFQKEYKGWVGEMKPGEMIELDKPTTDSKTGLVFYPAKEKFNKEQIAQVGRNAVRAVVDDEDKLDYYANRLAGIGLKEYQELDKVYQKYYGEPLGKSPERLAAAEAALEAEKFIGKETMKPKLDYERRQQDKINYTIVNKMPVSDQEAQINDMYGRIEAAVDSPKKTSWWKGTKTGYTPLSDLDVDAQIMVLDYAKKLSGLTGGQQGVEYLDNSNVSIKRTKEGDIGIYEGSNYLGKLPRVGTNIKVQADVKGKRAVVEQGEKTKITKRTYKGLDKDGNPIFE